MKHFYILACFVLLAILVINYPSTTGKVDYVSLSENDLSDFIEDRDIEPLAIETVHNQTYLLADGQMYYLSKNKRNGEVEMNHAAWGGGESDVQLGFQSADSPYVRLILDDKTLQEQAEEVEVVFDDGKTVSRMVGDQRGFLLFYDKQAKDLTVEGFDLHIYDEDENVLFEKKG